MNRCTTLLLSVAVLAGSLPLFAQEAPTVDIHGQQAPELQFDSTPNFLKLPPDLYMGEAAGVATNSKGHIFVFVRSGDTRLFEFDPNGNYLHEILPHLYAWAFAHSVRVDAHDNIWVVDEGSNMIVKLDPEEKVEMVLGRKPESAEGDTPGGWNYHPPVPGAPPPAAKPYDFNRETDIAWDAAGDSFVSDGYGNSRVVKYDKNGVFVKDVGSKGKAPGEFSTPHTIAVDREGNVYVGDRGNRRIQVFDNDLRLKTIWTGMGAPWAICITPGPGPQYVYSADADGPIYKMDLQGHALGKFGTAGKRLKQFGWVHELDCVGDNQLLAAEILNWRVQKITVHPQP